MTRRGGAVALVTACALIAVGCGGDDSSDDAVPDDVVPSEPTTSAPSESADDIASSPTSTVIPAATGPVDAGDPAGAPADGPPDLTEAAATLGVTEQQLRDALGNPPDFAAAAESLGVTLDELMAVLPPPPDQQGGQGGPAEAAMPIPEAATVAAAEGIDITDAILTSQSVDCADYADQYSSDVTDLSQDTDHEGGLSITVVDGGCLFESNNVPNHDFADDSSRFATVMRPLGTSVTVPADPAFADEPTALTQESYDAIMLNGVVLDILSAGCYDPTSPQADPGGNVAIGCPSNHPWLIDPMGTLDKFGADEHNAHTQPDGRYHYHASPNALYDDDPAAGPSPVIGFAADGFPIFGPYFTDPATGEVRAARSGYTLKQGERPSSDTDPGGTYSGVYNHDYEFTDAGDLDECNGMTVDGSYGYYVTDAYPWVLNCFSGTPSPSFDKN